MEEKDTSAQTTAAQSESVKETDANPQSEPQGTDWKAEARKWEKYAKANKTKADAWDKAQKEAKAQETTLETMQKQLEELQAQAQQARADAKHQSLLSSVSDATGIPASLIKGDTEEEMTASAKAITEFAKSKGSTGFPQDKGGGANAPTMTKKSIEEIKDPIARIKARAENIELYK